MNMFLINFILYRILPPIIFFYDAHIRYRVRKAVGMAMVRYIKNRGIDLRIHGHCRFLDPQNLEIGDYVRIGYNCFFYCKGGIKIGNNVQFSRNITIYSQNHNYESSAIPYDNTFKPTKPVIIGDNVWIGMNVSILPGVEIGEGAIIGMGVVVSQNVKPGAIIINTGSTEIKTRNMEHYFRLKEEGSFFGKLFPEY